MYLGANNQYSAGPAGFIAWLQDRMPEVHKKLEATRPDLIAPGQLVKMSRWPEIARRKRRQRSRNGLTYEGYNYDTGDYQLWGLGQDIPTIEVDTTKPAPTEETWADKVSSWVAPLVNVYQQKKMIDLQLERARAGLPPLADDALAAKVKVTTGFDKYIPWVILGVGGIVLIKIL